MNFNTSTLKFVRSQLQVDTTPELKRQLKQIAARDGITLKEVVLSSIAEKYPELRNSIADGLKEK